MPDKSVFSPDERLVVEEAFRLSVASAERYVKQYASNPLLKPAYDQNLAKIKAVRDKVFAL